MPERTKKPNPLGSISGLVSAGCGWVLSQYCGASIWIPGAAAIVFLLLFINSPIRPKYFGGAIATTLGHITAFVLGSALTGNWSATALDIIVLTAGVVWLWLRPGLAAALFLGMVQLASLAINVYNITLVPFGSFPHRALAGHCALRLIAIICLIVGYLALRRKHSTPPPPPVPSVAIS
ncbi:hypothetical protein CfE428DRAFT_5655 [Chthoniobacter flavus Ellin428]|uniref:Uncharacterized protein n=1 Tax=Chthoniobacter flavus Ellin428 TaxID=497964 RepID=B4D9R5_9BACT|nr:hypothetical protein [Chthoniobacter flavus]EDY16846.1 hypothetical protein CfE428DRAFT_5655 [Chthoniobacter flavus Ellin428]TCO93331.1 hypothetical protein EV701_10433 [Chthoniobacter flavus]